MGFAASALLIVALGAPSDTQLVQRSRELRAELAGWLRGTDACRAERVSRRLAELLRAQGVAAEAHPAGQGGGFTVATVGPIDAPIAALVLAPLTTCPGTPDSAELAYGAPARPLWRAAALAAALERLAHAQPSKRVRALFLAGDAAGHCGRGFVELTYPDLAEGAPILEEGGLLLEADDATRLVLGLASPRQERIWLRVRDGERHPGDRLDRALAVVEHAELELAPGRTTRAMLAGLSRDSVSAERRAQDPRLAALLRARCTLGPRADRRTAAIDCALPPEASVADLAYAIHQQLSDPSVLIGWSPSAAPSSATCPASVRRASRRACAAIIAPRAKVIDGVGPAPRCVDPAINSAAIGLPLMPTPTDPDDADPERFARGVRFTHALLKELAGARFDHPRPPGYDH